MSAVKETYDPFKDPDIHLRPEPPVDDREPTHADLSILPKYSPEDREFMDRPDHLADLPQDHRASLEEQGLEPYNTVPWHPPGKPVRIDWGRAAELLAKGTSVESTAGLLYCDAKRIWRNLRRSRKFRARVEVAAERMKMQADLRFRSLNIHAALQMKHRAEKLDTKTLHWLAERLRMGEAPEKTASLIDWLEAVAAPSGPSRKRRARAAAAPAPQAAKDGAATGLNGTQQDSTGFNGTQLALNGIELASNGTELAPNGLQLAALPPPPRPAALDKPLNGL